MNKVAKILHKKSKARSREYAISNGAYDGRLSTKIVKNKKKDLHKKYRKNKIKSYMY